MEQMTLMHSALLSLQDAKTPKGLEAAVKESAKSGESLREAVQDFEAFFLSRMFEHMFEGLEVDPMFGGGKGEEIFRSLMIDEIGKMTARSGGVGIADQMMRQLLAMQESET